MKRLHLSLLFLLVLHLTASEVLAQVQRLAIPPQRFSLIGNGASHDTKAYCLDRHLLISDPTDFRAVSAGDIKAVRVGKRLLTLKEAIDQNLITVKGAGVSNRPDYSKIDGTQLKFTSKTNEPITINFTRTVAMGEQGSSPVNPPLLVPVRESQSLADFRSVQDQIWRLGMEESRLETLGFYGSGIVIRNSLTTPRAVQAFQKKFNLPQQNGVLDKATTIKLDQIERQEIEIFERNGFQAARSDTDVPSVVDNIRAFEEFIRRPSTGKLTDELRVELDKFVIKYGPFLRQIRQVNAAEALPSDVSILKDNPSVITFQKAAYYLTRESKRGDLTAILFKTAKGIEFWQMRNGGLESRAIGEDAIVEFDKTSRFIAAIKIDSKTLTVRSGIYKSGGKVSLQLGQNMIELSESDMEKFLAGELKHPKIDEALGRLLADDAARPRVIIYRSAFTQGRGGAGNDGSLLTQFGYKQHDPIQLALAFEDYDAKFGDKFDVIVASDKERGIANLKALPKHSAGSKIEIFIDDQFKQSTRIINRRIEEVLRDKGIKILKAGDDPASQTRLFLFPGHRDEAFQQLVFRLADEGFFRGSIIVLAVCGGGQCDAQFNSLLISRSGARGVMSYNQDIRADAVQTVVLKFSELSVSEDALNGNYHQLWRKAVDAVLNDRNTTTNLRPEVRKLRDIIIQVSTVWRKSSSSNAE